MMDTSIGVFVGLASNGFLYDRLAFLGEMPMATFSEQHLALSMMAGVCLFLVLCTRTVPAQSAPVSPDHPWHTSAELKIEADAMIPDLRTNIDSTRTYALAELVDLAEAHNPATRVDWERARVQAGALGVTRSELLPTLASAAVSQTARQQAFFGNRFYGQETQNFQAEMDLNYTLFDFGTRAGRINQAKAQLLAANFAFNDTHRRVVYQVQLALLPVIEFDGAGGCRALKPVECKRSATGSGRAPGSRPGNSPRRTGSAERHRPG
jgi:hypothetical protein